MPQPNRQNSLIRGNKSSSDEFVQVYTQLIFLNDDTNWGDLLSAAPRSLAALGQAFIAAVSVASSQSITVEASHGLQYSSLRANLQHCIDLGQNAFMEAEGKMDGITQMAHFVTHDGGSVDKILQLCQNRSLAKTELPRQIKRLRMLSSSCVNDTEVLTQKFQSWGDMVGALRRACLETDDASKSRRSGLSSKSNIKEKELESQRNVVKNAKVGMQEQQKAVKIHGEDMRKAQEKIPKGWNAVAIDAVDSAKNGVDTFFNAAAASFGALRNVVAAGGPSVNMNVKYESNDHPSFDAKRRKAKEARKLARRKRRKLEVARQNYLDSQAAYAKSQELYKTLVANDQEQEAKFNKIQLQLQKLAHEGMKMGEIIQVLEECLKNLIEFKEHIIKLQQFFNRVHTWIESIDKLYVSEFTHGASQLGRHDIDDAARTYYLGNVKVDALKVKGSYLMIGELANNYVDVSRKHIIPGISLVNRLMQSSDSEGAEATSPTTIVNRVQEINSYARKAQTHVSRIKKDYTMKTKAELREMGDLISEAGQTIEDGEEALDAEEAGEGEPGNVVDEDEGDEDDEGGDDDDEVVWEDYEPSSGT